MAWPPGAQRDLGRGSVMAARRNPLSQKRRSRVSKPRFMRDSTTGSSQVGSVPDQPSSPLLGGWKSAITGLDRYRRCEAREQRGDACEQHCADTCPEAIGRFVRGADPAHGRSLFLSRRETGALHEDYARDNPPGSEPGQAFNRSVRTRPLTPGDRAGSAGRMPIAACGVAGASPEAGRLKTGVRCCGGGGAIPDRCAARS